MNNAERAPFWVSWWRTTEPFTYQGPWWISGVRMSDDAESICAAVMAKSADDAKRIIVEAHDHPVHLEWRFANVREPKWSPFCDRFARREWMQWPWPKT